MGTPGSAMARSESHGRWLWQTPVSFLFGCAWMLGAFAVLYFTLNNNTKQVPSPAEELAVLNAVMAAHHPGGASSAH
jgi:hypothetical protein